MLFIYFLILQTLLVMETSGSVKLLTRVEDEGFQIDINPPAMACASMLRQDISWVLVQQPLKTFLTTCVLIDLMYVLQILFTKAN